MITFWIIATALAVLAVAMLAWPTWRARRPEASRAEYDLAVYQDQMHELEREAREELIGKAEFDLAATEIQRRMLRIAEGDSGDVASASVKNRLVVPAAGMAAMAAALAMYVGIGAPGTPDHPHAARKIAVAAVDTPAPHGAGGEAVSVNEMVERLRVRLAKQPNDVKGWFLLGNSLKSLKRLDEASDAFRRALSLSNGHPAAAIAFAETVVAANDNTVIKEARDAFVTVLAADPRNIRARYFLGLARAQDGDLRAAIQDWIDLLELSPADAPWTRKVRDQIAFAAKEGQIDAAKITPSEAARKLKHQTAAVAPAKAPDARLASANAEEMEMIRSMVDQLAQRLAEAPDDLDGWRRLAQAYGVLGETVLAQEAMAEVSRLEAKVN